MIYAIMCGFCCACGISHLLRGEFGWALAFAVCASVDAIVMQL